jgi:hypothetical protein
MDRQGFNRRLFLAAGCSSLFGYCTRVLHLAEHAAYLRIKAVRAVRRFPVILDALACGDLNLTSIRLLSPHLTAENCGEILDEARHCSRKQIELLVARLHPLPDVAARIRKLPARKPAPSAAPEVMAAPEVAAPVGVVAARLLPESARAVAQTVAAPVDSATSRPREILRLAPERFMVQFTVSADMHDKLRRAQDLLRRQIPNGDLAQVFELALNTLLERLDKEKFAATDRPRASRGVAAGSRAIPAEVKRAVWKRDGGQCAFIGSENRRCNEASFLEFHHVVPYARCGEASIENIALRCKAHNQYEALLDFGPRDLPIVRESETPWGLQR